MRPKPVLVACSLAAGERGLILSRNERAIINTGVSFREYREKHDL
jgi:hypothetical protein